MSGRAKRTFEVGRTLDRFRLMEQLGAGAYGQVWLALDEGAYGFRKKIALKILTEEGSPEREEALLREARICGALNHPNIVDVHGVMRVDDVPFILMEYVQGETLSSLWRDLAFLDLRFPRAVILEIGIAAAEALHHAWTARQEDGTELRIVHRDLKPANIMVSNRGVAKVGDFGIAKVARDLSTTRSGKLKGTPSYMAPELWMGQRDFRPAIDLWSLGIILWEMAAGRRFYGNAGMMDIPDMIRTRKPWEEAREIEDFFPELAPIVTKLLQRRMIDRYDDGLKVAEALRCVRTNIRGTGDLLQFVRLVRAGRTAPSMRHGSLVALPSIPEGADDWRALIELARAEGESENGSMVDSLAAVEPVSGIEPSSAAHPLVAPATPTDGDPAPNDETRAEDSLRSDSTTPSTTPSLPRWDSGFSGPGMLPPLRRRTEPSRNALSAVARDSSRSSGKAAPRFSSSTGSLDATDESKRGVLPPRPPSPRTRFMAPLKAADGTDTEESTFRSPGDGVFFGRLRSAPPWVYAMVLVVVTALFLWVLLR